MLLLLGNRKSMLNPRTAPYWVSRAEGVPASPYAEFDNGRYWVSGRSRVILDNANWWASATGETFSRGSAGNYFNSSGLLASAATNVLRTVYDPSTLQRRGILLEGAGTNQFLQSNTFSNASWTQTNVTVAQNATGPDGATSAWTITGTATNVNRVQQTFAGLATGTYALSAFVKGGTSPIFWMQTVEGGGGVRISYFNTSTGAWGTVGQGVSAPNAVVTALTPVNCGNGIWRAPLKVVLSSGTLTNFLIGFCEADADRTQTNGHTGILFGAQIESGANASSYVATTTTAATRSADSLTRTRVSPTTIAKMLAGRTPLGVATEQILWSADDGTANNRIRATYKSDGHIHVIVTSGGVDQADLDMGAVAVNTDFRLVFRAGANDFAASLNGGAIVSDISGTMPSGLVNDRLGSGLVAGNEWYSTIKTDAEWITTSRVQGQFDNSLPGLSA